ncbi:MAG TPA: CocE/NonD family hydrolase [Spirochaetota bacterium]|nr:CocE/NonD family hydrolase [Spirochaetota bacterium]HPI88941.1 CocE/NonD family hydrolase [Spirochaetota bacterium]HPR46582.1 CocE/NonD family hydrolase [Spirochaetota bacterium]
MMKNIVIMFFAGFVITLIFFSGCSNSDESGDRSSQSSYFNYDRYQQPEYSGSTKQSEYVTMSDSVDLAVDIYLPSDGPARDSFPVVFMYTPYNRATINPETGTVSDNSTHFLISYGYAVVVADMRGTGASFGTQGPFIPKLGEDGKELVDWIASQSWCDGNVGMMGQSYLGWSQLATAKNKPGALKCIMPEVAPFEGYTAGFRPGGIAAQNWITKYSAYLNGKNLNYFYPSAGMLPAVPVIDEDGDGELVDEIPEMDEGNSWTFLDDTLSYADGSSRTEDYLYNATMAHTSNITFANMSEYMPWIDSPAPSPYEEMSYTDGSPGSFAQEIMDSGIAIYNIGGWFDGFTRCTVKMFATLRSVNPSKLIMAPRFHMPYITSAYANYFAYEGSYTEQMNIERLRFFDRYLMGIDNGIDSEPPVYVYTMNDGWRTENEWPLERQEITSFFFNEGNSLSEKQTQDGTDVYTVDFTHTSTYGSNTISRWLMMYMPDSTMTRTAKDNQCLVYETSPLDSDTEVTGHPVVDFWVSSNQAYGDFYVYLTDVDEDEESIYVTEGKLRAGWKNLHEDDDQVDGVVDVLPELPWHGYKESDFVDGVLSGSAVIELRFDLIPTSWLFKQGHRIRVAIACADAEEFELNPGLAPSNDPAELPPTEITVHRSLTYTSRIELPVIPR